VSELNSFAFFFRRAEASAEVLSSRPPRSELLVRAKLSAWKRSGSRLSLMRSECFDLMASAEPPRTRHFHNGNRKQNSCSCLAASARLASTSAGRNKTWRAYELDLCRWCRSSMGSETIYREFNVLRRKKRTARRPTAAFITDKLNMSFSIIL
jgi:hypothetical protein